MSIDIFPKGEYGKAVKAYEAVLKKHPEAGAVKAQLIKTRKLAEKRGRGVRS